MIAATTDNHRIAIRTFGIALGYTSSVASLADDLDLVGTAVDVTAEKQNQERLRSLSEALRTTVQRFEIALRGAEITVFAEPR